MIRVAHILRRFSFDEWGGTESVVWNSVLQQRQMDMQVEILATCALDKPGLEERMGVIIRRFPYRYPYLFLSPEAKTALDRKGGNPVAPQLLRALRNGNFDLVHIHCGGRLAREAALAAKELHIPSLITLHGGCADVPKEEIKKMMAPTAGALNYGGIMDRLTRRNRIDPLTIVDAVLCLSSQEESMLAQRYPKQRIIRFPNGVANSYFAQPQKPLPPDPRPDYAIPPQRKILLCISRIDYQKNQLLLVEALRQFPNHHLVLIGPVTSQWYSDKILAAVKEYHLEERFTLIPGLPPESPLLHGFLRHAQCFILPSQHEPFGIVVLEAWAAGVPVIASTVGGLRDLIQPDCNGLAVPPDDLPALITAIRRMDEEPAIAQRLAANAYQQCQSYRWDSLMAKMKALYLDLIARHDHQ